MGTLQPDGDAKGELDDSGCIQDGSPSEKKQAIEKMDTLENGYTGQAKLLDLSDDVLLCILKHCTPRDLKALGYTCTRLGALVRDRTLWMCVDARQQPSGRARLRWLLSNVLSDGTTELLLCGYAREARGCLGHVTRARREDEGKPPGAGAGAGDADNNNVRPSTSGDGAGPSGAGTTGAPVVGAPAASTQPEVSPAKNVTVEDPAAAGVSANIAAAPVNNGVPANIVTVEGAPANNVLPEDAPVNGAPAERAADVDPLAFDAPVENRPAEAAVAEGAPVNGAPAERAADVDPLGLHAPVENAPAEAAVAEGAPAERAADVDPLGLHAPVENPPAEAAVAEGAPAERAADVDPLALDAPVQNPPAVAAAAEGAPVEGAPAGGEANRNGRAEPPYPLARQHARLHISAQQLPRFSGAPSWLDDFDPDRPDDLIQTDSSCSGPQFTVTQQMLKELQLQCTKLTSLSLEYCNINCKKTGISHFPPTLKKLSLRGTKCYNLPLDKSFLFKIQDYLPNLEYLDVSESEWMEPATLLPLSKVPNLMTLIMRECVRMTEFVAYASLATRYGFRKLKVLDMRGSPVGDSEVSAFGWVPELEELYLSPAEGEAGAGEGAGAGGEPAAEHSHFKGDALPPHDELEQWEIDEEPTYQPIFDSAESVDTSLDDMEEQDEYMGDQCHHGSDFNICNEGVRIEVSLRASNGDGPREQIRQIERYSIRRRPRDNGVAANQDEPAPGPSQKRKTSDQEKTGEKKPKYAENEPSTSSVGVMTDNIKESDDAKTADDAKNSNDANVADDKGMSDDAKTAKTSDDAETPDDNSRRHGKRRTRSADDSDKNSANSKRKRQGDVNEGASTSRTIDIRLEISREPIDDPADRNPGPDAGDANDSSPNNGEKKSDSDDSDDDAPKKRKNAVGVAVNASVNSTEQVEVQVQIRENEGQDRNQGDGEQNVQGQAPDEQGQGEARERRGHFSERRGRRGASRRRRYDNVVRFRQDQDPVIIQCPILPQRQPEDPPENQEGEPRHHILYVNVGQQLHAVYRLLPSRPIFHSMRNRNWRPNMRNVFYSPSQPHVDSASLVTDSAIRRFGRADGDHINYVNIGPNGPYPAARDADGRPVGLLGARDLGARPDRSNLRILSVTGYRHITDRSLLHLATSAPHLRRIDLTRTGVTAQGVQNFRNLRPDCEVIFSEYVDKDQGANGDAE